MIIVATAPVWLNYLGGFGPPAYVQILALEAALAGAFALCIVFLVSLCLLIIRAVQRRPTRALQPLLLACAALSLCAVTPRFVARPLKKLGAMHRLEKLDGGKAQVELLKAARSLLSTSPPDSVHLVERADWPEVFERLGATVVWAWGGPDAHVEVRTSGRPIETGWFIYPDKDANWTTMGFEVYPGIYRYCDGGS